MFGLCGVWRGIGLGGRVDHGFARRMFKLGFNPFSMFCHVAGSRGHRVVHRAERRPWQSRVCIGLARQAMG